MIDIEKTNYKSEQPKSEFGQSMGRATASKEDKPLGVVDEAKDKTLAAVAELTRDVKKGAGGAQDQIADIGGKAKAAMPELNTPTIIVAVVILALVAAWRLRAARQRRAHGWHFPWNPAH